MSYTVVPNLRHTWLSFALVPMIALLISAARPQPTTIALGVYQPGAPADPAVFSQLQNTLGRMPAIVLWYQDWAHGDASRFPTTAMNNAVRVGAMPLLTWEPWDWQGGPNQPAFALRQIANGAYDGYLHQWAHDAAAWNSPFYLRFAHEMNGNWYPWAAGVNGNTPGDYVAAWRHIVGIFRQEQATNVRWVWSANVEYAGSTPFASVYPGDTWVDWVALDGYNWGTSQPWSGWQSFYDIFNASYRQLVSLTTRPLMISEVACADQGGDKARWINQAFVTDIPGKFPRIAAVVWFNERKEANWPFDSSARSLAAFRNVAASKQYQGKLP